MKLGATELISRCKAGERQAMDLLYQQYRPRLLNICMQYTKEDSVAEDLLHDAFVIILTSLDKLEQTDHPESWMASIVKNLGYHYRQYSKKEQKALQQMAEEERNVEEETQTPNYDELLSLISQLPKGYQQVFRLSVFEGLSHQEISKLLGIAPHSSSSQLSHAKRMLRMLIKQSWVLMLLLIAIPTAIWMFLNKQTHTEEQKPVADRTETKPQPPTSIDVPEKLHVYSQASTPSPINQESQNEHLEWKTLQPSYHPNEVAVKSDTASYLPTDSMLILQNKTTQTEKDEKNLKDSMIYLPIPWQPNDEQMAHHPVNVNSSWNISLAYNGQVGSGEDFMGTTTVEKNSFNAMSNQFIPSGQTYSNWIDYYNYLKTNPSIHYDTETRSLMRIATQNTYVNNGAMEARYEHRLPITLQLMLSRQISQKASIETGLSYTQLNSTITTGSTNANIQERQRLCYLGIPIRFGWQWYENNRFYLYTSTGPMLELPIHSTTVVRYFSNDSNTFQKEVSPSVPVQWSVSFGLGAQYNVTPYIGIYLEPSMQYFFNDGSSLKTYRTEHPLEFTLPFGIRFQW